MPGKAVGVEVNLGLGKPAIGLGGEEMEILSGVTVVTVGLVVRMALVAVALVVLGIPAAVLLFVAWVVTRMRHGVPEGCP